ncbi:MAG: hypothetical protein NTZ16_07900 [Verrucomicrobia bacterium]|nr:hypothetical protein [Verrucomicrobiota bacterium]
MKPTFAVIATLLPLAFATLSAAAPDFQSRHLAIGLAAERPAFNWFAVDSLGQGKLAQNPVLAETSAAAPGLTLEGRFTYTQNGQPVWRVACEKQKMTLRADYVAGQEPPPFTLTFNQKLNHATLLGLMSPGERRMALPCVLHLPDMGSVRITCNVPGAKLDYDARRRTKPAFVRIAFPAATASQPHIEYHFEVVAIYPQLPGIENDPLYDGFRRDFLNLFQVNPRFQGLANNAASDPVAFSIFTYSELAPHVPPLAKNLTCLDLVRMTLDRYLAGEKGYGQVGYGPSNGLDVAGWGTPWTSSDTLPSFLIAAGNYVEGARDTKWARDNYAQLAAWAREMMAADKDDNGLIEYPGTGNYGDRPTRERRPSNRLPEVCGLGAHVAARRRRGIVRGQGRQASRGLRADVSESGDRRARGLEERGRPVA